MKYRLPITLAGVAVVLGLVAFAYFQNWVSVCAVAVGLAARLAERILVPRKDPKAEELQKSVACIEEWLEGAASTLSTLNDRLAKLELKSGMNR